jgi:uncharacterized membrane protein YdcZ (DUF606 family)
MSSTTTTVAAGLAVFAGVLIVVQAALLGVFERYIHPVSGAFWVHVAGVVFGASLVLVARTGWGLPGVVAFPWGLLAGVAGIGIVASIAAAVAGAGLGTTLVIVVATQLVLGFALDAVGVTGVVVPITAPRLVGLILVVVGALLVYGRTPEVG